MIRFEASMYSKLIELKPVMRRSFRKLGTSFLLSLFLHSLLKMDRCTDFAFDLFPLDFSLTRHFTKWWIASILLLSHNASNEQRSKIEAGSGMKRGVVWTVTMEWKYFHDFNMPRYLTNRIKQEGEYRIAKLKYEHFEVGEKRGNETNELLKDREGEGWGGKRMKRALRWSQVQAHKWRSRPDNNSNNTNC